MSFGTTVGQVVEGGTGEFQDVPDDIYEARVLTVSDVFADTYEGETKQKVTIEFELLPTDAQLPDEDGVGCPEGYTRMYWLTLTDRFLETGAISDNSNLYFVLQSLGYDMGGPVQFDSDDWIGKTCRVDIAHNKKGYPTITGFKAPRTKPTQRQTPQREPAAAGRAR